MQKLMKPLLLIWLTIGLTFTFNQAKAQLPTNLSNIKASQITDAQLMQFLQQSLGSRLHRLQYSLVLLFRRCFTLDIPQNLQWV